VLSPPSAPSAVEASAASAPPSITSGAEEGAPPSKGDPPPGRRLSTLAGTSVIMLDSVDHAYGTPWVTATPRGQLAKGGPDGSSQCEYCVGLNLTAPIRVEMEPWDFEWYPFDSHFINFSVSVVNGDIFQCADLFSDIDGAPGVGTFLPPTDEWVVESAVASPGASAAECAISIRISRKPEMFIVKQVIIAILVVLSGLSAPFLHVADHTGDRCALILASALIIALTFQTKLGLGPLAYITWWDRFNLAMMALLFFTLAETLAEHHLFVTDRELASFSLNAAFRVAMPVLYFPLVLAGLLLYGLQHWEVAIAVWVFGLLVASSYVWLRVHRRMSWDARERAAVTEALRQAAAESPSYAHNPAFAALIKRAFEVFDLDASGSIGLGELREMILAIHPDAHRARLAEAMLFVRQYGNDDEFDFSSLVDALAAVESKYAGELRGREDSRSDKLLGNTRASLEEASRRLRKAPWKVRGCRSPSAHTLATSLSQRAPRSGAASFSSPRARRVNAVGGLTWGKLTRVAAAAPAAAAPDDTDQPVTCTVGATAAVQGAASGSAE